MLFGFLATAALAVLTIPVEAIRDRQQFKVQVKVTQGNKKFDGLWASLYHTGAATADVYFQNDRSKAFSAFLNHTQFQWAYTGVPNIPYALNLQYQTYSAWGPLEVTPGYGEDYYGKGFKFGKGNSIVDTFEEWTGWLGNYTLSSVYLLWQLLIRETKNLLVCDWWHQVPQLFWTQVGFDLEVIPTCAKVNLIAKT
ncbi:hypothetical protein H072_8105 [Dactylellina haptotyla CBS 200.50]|uniref:DUF7907 domain-containing protein n=1 Tax=Dactylellina haptotyla (strain CBS 200.50) TaxID=1284197 RepID=S8BG39_DACHA|nr:hypothetical protein H072_8105 [Dactylellina haptotyla CBS 200.50]